MPSMKIHNKTAIPAEWGTEDRYWFDKGVAMGVAQGRREIRRLMREALQPLIKARDSNAENLVPLLNVRDGTQDALRVIYAGLGEME